MGEKDQAGVGGMMKLHVKVRISTGWFIMSCHSYYTSRRFFFHDAEIFRTFTTVGDEKGPFSIPPFGRKMPQFYYGIIDTTVF